MRSSTRCRRSASATGRLPLLLAGLATLVALAGCATEDGQPWGQARFSLSTAFSPDASRLDEDGRLITSSGYAVELETLSLRFGALTLTLTGLGETLAFDPADPPEGYSLCHNGHCHADDGSLVSYKDVSAGLAQGSGGLQQTQAVDATVDMLADQTDVTLDECPDSCALERGELATVQLDASRLSVSATLFDDGGAGDDWPADGVAYGANFDLELTWSALVSGTVDSGESVGVSLAAAFEFSPKLFDGVHWADAEQLGSDGTGSPSSSGDAELLETLAGNLSESTLSVTVSRFTP